MMPLCCQRRLTITLDYYTADKHEESMKHQRIVIVDILTFFATIIVVLGHHKALRVFDISWFSMFDGIIYSFHMGFFMTISGFLIKYTFPSDCNRKLYLEKKIRKFVPAYLGVGMLAAVISFTTWNDFFLDLLMLLINTTQGPIQIIWYVYVLLFFYCLSPMLFRLSKISFYFIFIFSLFLSAGCSYFPSWFNMRLIFRLLPFFLLGALISDNRVEIQKISKTFLFFCSVPFLCFILSWILFQRNVLSQSFGGDVARLISSLLSLPFMYFIGKILEHSMLISKLSMRFAKYVYPVYLLQMFFINLIWKIRGYLRLELNEITAIVYIIVSTILTICGVIIFMKFFLWVKCHIKELFILFK